MSNAQRSERTPLLSSSSSSRRPSSSRSRRPSNASRNGTPPTPTPRPQARTTPPRPRPLSIAALVEAQEPSHSSFLDYVRGRFDLDSETPAVRLSLTLLLLLQYRRSLKDTLAKGREDILGSASTVRQAKADLESVEQQDIPAVLDRLAQDIARDSELWDVLTTSWLREDGREGRVRVIDFMCIEDGVPDSMLRHELISYALEKRWAQGEQGQNDAPRSMWARYDALCTPRINLLLHNLSLWMYFALLASYLIYPPRHHRILPDSPVETYHARECFLVLTSLGIGLNPLYRGTLHTISAIVTFIQFVTTLPDVPYPSEGSFFYLSLALVFTFVAFHSPSSITSPMLLISRTSRTWPLALFLWNDFSNILIPSITVLVPSLLVISVLLSIALSTTPYEGPDTALLETIGNAFGLSLSDRTNMTPMETREMLFTVLLVVIACMAGAVFLACTRVPAEAADTSLNAWDRYGPLIAVRTRQSFTQAVAVYSTVPTKEGTITERRIETRTLRPRYMFPPPLNLIHLLLVAYPRAFAFLMTWRGRATPLQENAFTRFLDSAEAVLWRTLIGPFAAIPWTLSWIVGRLVR
ncbi:hypothetical protein K525DRAFT_188623 [Schizophyllum commune Loenen D]|nr:hypothetical protein K525DRAFT_188623 [Schizophyllum commune Loenen D]